MTEKEFKEFIKNISKEDIEKIIKETEEEIFTKDFCKELNLEVK